MSVEAKRKLAERLGVSVENAGVRLIDRFWHRGSQRQFH